MTDAQRSNDSNSTHNDQASALAAAREWAARRTYAGTDFPPERIRELAAGRSITVVIPTKETAATIGRTVAECVALREMGAVSEVIVVDAKSADGTADIARQKGATVHQESDLLPELGPALGKGDALWRSLSVASGEFIVYVDSDSINFQREFVCGLVGPLLQHESLELVKGSFRRPYSTASETIHDGGGRVTELAARPLLNTLFPALAAVNQPLSGEIAGRKATLEIVPFFTGYGSEIQTLIDFYERFGLDAIAQTDLGERINAHQALADLGPMSFAVMRAILSRVKGTSFEATQLGHYLGYREGILLEREAPLVLRPPMREYLAGNGS